MNFVSTPARDLYNIARIGGVKAGDFGFLLLGTGHEEILEYVDAPGAVATLWRDELVALLSNHRRHRPVKQLDWLALAATVDPAWASKNGWTGPSTTPAASASPAAAPSPLNRLALASAAE